MHGHCFVPDFRLRSRAGDIGVSGYLWKGVDSSFSLIGLVAAFGIARSFSNQHGADGVSSGIISVSLFIKLSPFVSGETGSGITMDLMGACGIFVASNFSSML